VVEASLGYFITPLVSILLTMLVLRETLSRHQKIAVALAATGVLYSLFGQGTWIALVLVCSFGLYGLIRARGLRSHSISMAENH
jgi:chloramphenicol-sensitive protein RarD